MKRKLGGRSGLPLVTALLFAALIVAPATSVAAASPAGKSTATHLVAAHALAAQKTTKKKKTTSKAATKSVVRAALPTGAIKHVMVIEMENEAEQTTFGAGSPATYLNDVLRKQGELIPHYFGTGHSSLDNYIAQVAGQAPNDATGADCMMTGTPGSKTATASVKITNVTPGTKAKNQKAYPGQAVGTGCVYPKWVQTIAGQIDNKWKPNSKTHVAQWRDYDEDMGNIPSRDGGATDPTGGTDCGTVGVGGQNETNAGTAASGSSPADQYASRHNPFVWFHSILDNKKLCDANVVPLGTLTDGKPSTFNGVALPDTFSGHLKQDLSKVSTTPKFMWVTPNLCDDGHDTNCAGPNSDGVSGTGAGGLVGVNAFLQHWMPMIEASPAYRQGHMLVVITFDEGVAGNSDDNEQPGPSDPTPGFSPWFTATYKQYNIPIPTVQTGGGETGAVLLDPEYIKAGSVDKTGKYNHYSALRSYEDLLGITTGGTDGEGHLGFAAAKGLKPFGKDVFNK